VITDKALSKTLVGKSLFIFQERQNWTTDLGYNIHHSTGKYTNLLFSEFQNKKERGKKLKIKSLFYLNCIYIIVSPQILM